MISTFYPYWRAGPIFPHWPFDDEFLYNTTGSLTFSTREKSFPPNTKFFPSGTAELAIPFRELMLCAGLMLSPATSSASPSAWGFLLEHIDSLSKRPGKLRAASHAKKWDPRIKAIFSERISCGLAAWALWNIDSVAHIADAGDFIGRTGTDIYFGKGLDSLGLYGENGGYKPDFFCLTKVKNECLIVECKGAMGPPSALSADIKKGKEQVSNVKPRGVSMRPDASQLVFALNIRYECDTPKKDADTSLCVIDPTFSENAVDIDVQPDRLALLSYAKALNLSNRKDLISFLFSNQRLSENFIRSSTMVFDERLKFIPISIASGQVFGFTYAAALDLFTKPLQGLSNRASQYEPYEKRQPEENEMEPTVLPNGFLMLPHELMFSNKVKPAG